MIGPTDLLNPSSAPHIKNFHVLLMFCPKRPSFSNIQSHARNLAYYLWSMAFYGAENWTLRVADQKYLENFEKWW